MENTNGLKQKERKAMLNRIVVSDFFLPGLWLAEHNSAMLRLVLLAVGDGHRFSELYNMAMTWLHGQ